MKSGRVLLLAIAAGWLATGTGHAGAYQSQRTVAYQSQRVVAYKSQPTVAYQSQRAVANKSRHTVPGSLAASLPSSSKWRPGSVGGPLVRGAAITGSIPRPKH